MPTAAQTRKTASTRTKPQALHPTPTAAGTKPPRPAPARKASTKKTPEQPVTVLGVPGALLMPRTTSVVTGLSIPTLYRKLAAKEFPEPVRIGARCTRWRSDDVRAWLAAQG